MIIGVTAALLGPKDLPIIARTAGRLTGRAIGYVQLARGQLEKVMQQSEIHQVHKEAQDLTAKVFEDILNPGRRLVDNFDQTSSANVQTEAKKPGLESIMSTNSSSKVTHLPSAKDHRFPTSAPVVVRSQATSHSKLAVSTALNTGPVSNEVLNELTDESGLTVLPVSAEGAGLLPDKKDDIKGSDIVLEAVLESQVAYNAKDFFHGVSKPPQKCR